MRKTVSVASASILMRTRTTIKFNPMRKTFITVERTSSGMYLLRILPTDGQYIPQHTSKTQNPMRTRLCDCERIGIASDADAITKIHRSTCSTGRTATSASNILDPIIVHTMKPAKTTPCGSGGGVMLCAMLPDATGAVASVSARRHASSWGVHLRAHGRGAQRGDTG